MTKPHKHQYSHDVEQEIIAWLLTSLLEAFPEEAERVLSDNGYTKEKEDSSMGIALEADDEDDDTITSKAADETVSSDDEEYDDDEYPVDDDDDEFDDEDEEDDDDTSSCELDDEVELEDA